MKRRTQWNITYTNTEFFHIWLNNGFHQNTFISDLSRRTKIITREDTKLSILIDAYAYWRTLPALSNKLSNLKLAWKRVTINSNDKSLDICISYEASRGNDKSVRAAQMASATSFIGGPVFKVHGIQRYLQPVCERTSCCAIPSPVAGKRAINSRRSLASLEPCSDWWKACSRGI